MPVLNYPRRGLARLYRAEFNIWCGMRKRCHSAGNPGYPRYGGRGIRVCERWRTSFRAFLEDMGPRPKGLSIERRDNGGSYCPDNCYWATRKQQQRNRRNTRILTLRGETRSLPEWAEVLGISPVTLSDRLRRGWSVEEALTLKARQRQGREVLFSKDGKTLRLGQWAELLGIRLDLIVERRQRGWDLGRAIFTPPGPNGKKKNKAKG